LNTSQQANTDTDSLAIDFLLFPDTTSYTNRTDTCGSLCRDHVGRQVKLSGWLQYQRMSGSIVVLRDWHGLTQLVIKKVSLHKKTL